MKLRNAALSVVRRTFVSEMRLLFFMRITQALWRKLGIWKMYESLQRTQWMSRGRESCQFEFEIEMISIENSSKNLKSLGIHLDLKLMCEKHVNAI